jgi:hypothetical protein
VNTILHVLAKDIPIDHLRPTTAAVEYALWLAQRGIPANALIRAYHMGQDHLLGEFFLEAHRLDGDAAQKLDVVRYISGVLYRYIDWMCQSLLEFYEEERQRWTTASGNVNSSLIHKVLAGEPVRPESFRTETGYDLEQFHVAAVLWTEAADPAPDEVLRLERSVRDLAAASRSSSPPIFTAVDRSTAWAWFPRDGDASPLDIELVRQLVARAPCRVALGLPTPGIAGFRRSHQQAEAVRALVLSASCEMPQVNAYSDQGVAIMSMLTLDLASTRTWVQEVLGPLARRTEAVGRLRETLQTFLATGGSFTESATLLSLHRNSVKYRVDRAVEERGRPIDEDRLDVELALQACHFLGGTVLAD